MVTSVVQVEAPVDLVEIRKSFGAPVSKKDVPSESVNCISPTGIISPTGNIGIAKRDTQSRAKAGGAPNSGHIISHIPVAAQDGARKVKERVKADEITH